MSEAVKEVVKAEAPKAEIIKSDAHVRKQALIKKHARAKGDTGSPEVQIAILTARINQLQSHFEKHVKDHHSRRGLLMMVSNRRSLLNYLKKTKPAVYEKLIAELGLRK